MNRTPGPNELRAKMFAEASHAGQSYDNFPYTYHLGQVVEMLKKFGFDDPVMLSAGWLHDSIEDTNRNYNDIASEFGTEVADLVYAVTNEKGKSRRERNEKTYPGIRGNDRAVALKLADRIANVEHGAINGGKEEMYKKEFAAFEAALRTKENEDDGIKRMWTHLARLLGIH